MLCGRGLGIQGLGLIKVVGKMLVVGRVAYSEGLIIQVLPFEEVIS